MHRVNIGSLNRAKICLLGFGREGQATLRALQKYAPDCKITVADRNVQTTVPGCEVQSGSAYVDNLERFQWIVKSPGIPISAEMQAVSDKLTSGTDIFLDTVADQGAAVIGVTGSKGKSTTSSLIYAALKAGSRSTYLVGNIGQPALDYLEYASPEVLFVFEMSSYQLMDVRSSPHVAVITSFFPEHLDYHGSLEAYWEAKSNIARFQTANDLIVYNGKFAACRTVAALSRGRKFPYTSEDCPIPLAATRLQGMHNGDNLAAAFMVVTQLGVERGAAIEAFRDFRGLPHRLESLGVYHGIEWVDDVLSTTPESTIAGLDALEERVLTLILGGQDRGYDFGTLAKRIVASHVENVILCPGSGRQIRSLIEQYLVGNAARVGSETMRPLALFDVEDMRAAVQVAKACTPLGGVCLLSPASPSYNRFRSYEEKARAFQSAVVAEETSSL